MENNPASSQQERSTESAGQLTNSSGDPPVVPTGTMPAKTSPKPSQPETLDNPGSPVVQVVQSASNVTEQSSSAFVFRLLIGFVPIGAAFAIFWVTVAYPYFFPNEKNPVPLITTVTEQRSTNPATPSTVITTTYPISNTGALGIFDPAVSSNTTPNLFLFGLLIFLVASIIETSLIMIYGTLYVNREENKDSPLGLPQGATRIFLLIIVILVLLTFSLLPGSWGDNKTVGIMFGILSTIVGFYFGSGAVSDGLRQGKQTQPQVTDTQTTNTAGRSETRTVEVKPSSEASGTNPTPQPVIQIPPDNPGLAPSTPDS